MLISIAMVILFLLLILGIPSELRGRKGARVYLACIVLLLLALAVIGFILQS